jgi:hypothetical protein
MAFVTLEKGTILYRGAEYAGNPFTSRDNCEMIYFTRNRKAAEMYAKLVNGKSKGYIWVYKTLKPISLLCLYDKERPMFHTIILTILKDLLHEYIAKKKHNEDDDEENDNQLELPDETTNGCPDTVSVEMFTSHSLMGVAEAFGLENQEKPSFERSSYLYHDLLFLNLLFASEFGREFRVRLQNKFKQFAEASCNRKLTEQQKTAIEKTKVEARKMMELCNTYIGYHAFEWPTGKVVDGAPQVFHEELCIQKGEGLLECVQSYKIANGSAVPFRCKEVVNGGSKRKGKTSQKKTKSRKQKGGDEACPAAGDVEEAVTEEMSNASNASNASMYFNRILGNGSGESHFNDV